MTIALLRKSIKRDVFDYQQLMSVLSEYSKPRDKITRLLTEGSIIRIKKGLYCFSEVFRKTIITREYLANLIYGPSYVSLQYALSYYGLIPERVEIVTSVTTGRNRRFETSFGIFTYKHLGLHRYSSGALIDTSGDTSYLIASPEKALIDTIWMDKRFNCRSIAGFSDYIFDDLRIDRDLFSGLNPRLIHKIAASFKSSKINKFVQFFDKQRRISRA